jgi:integrase/recombinase XerD
MAEIKLDYVNSFTDARGKPRHQFRRKGHKKITIRGRPGSEQFMEHYHALVAQTGGEVVAEAGASRTKAGTIDAFVTRYYGLDRFKKELSEVSRKMRRREIDNFRDFLTPSGRRYGDNRLMMMQAKQIDDFCEGKSDSIITDRIKALRHLFKFAIEQGEMKIDPTLAIKRKKDKGMGFMTWKPPQVEQYRARHPVGTMARVALELMLNIAARRTDVYQIGRPHMSFNAEIGANVLTWRPQKTASSTGKVLSIPVLPFLQEALDAAKDQTGTALTFLTTAKAMPFKNAGAFGRDFTRWCDEAELPAVLCADGKVRNYRAHGLRKAALYTLYKLGATTAQLQSIGGHSSLAELQKYIQEVEQDEQAVAAMALVATAQKVQIRKRALLTEPRPTDEGMSHGTVGQEQIRHRAVTNAS